MRRGVLVLCALAGCYRPAFEDTCSIVCGAGGVCPTGSHCEGTRCHPDHGECAGAPDDATDAPAPDVAEVDALVSPDAMIDAAGSTLCIPGPLAMDATITSGSDFTVNTAGTRAAKLAAGEIEEWEGPSIDNPTPSFVQVIKPPFGLTATVSAPRMSPDGQSIFLRGEDTIGDAAFLVSNRTAAFQWTQPAAFTLYNTANLPVAIGPSMIPGTPTALSPRRMAVQTSDGFTEYEEVTSTKWKEKFHVVAGSLGVTFLSAPNLTADGRHLVFVGTNGSFPNRAIWVADRASLAVPFASATHFFDDTSATEDAPFYTLDCKTLYYTNANAPVIIRAR